MSGRSNVDVKKDISIAVLTGISLMLKALPWRPIDLFRN